MHVQLVPSFRNGKSILSSPVCLCSPSVKGLELTPTGSQFTLELNKNLSMMRDYRGREEWIK